MTVATVYPSQDAMGSSSSAGATGTTGLVQGATGTTLQVGLSATCSGTSYYNSMLLFDLSFLTGKSVIDASFTYEVSTAGTLDANAFLATSYWVEVDGSFGPIYDLLSGGINLNFASTGVKTRTSAKWLAWIQNWANGIVPNYGFVIDWLSATNVGAMYSKEQTGTTSDPYLSVTYKSKPVITPTGSPGPSTSIPATGNVTVSYTFSDADGATLDQVAIRRRRLTGA